jgi:hypothetical protein
LILSRRDLAARAFDHRVDRLQHGFFVFLARAWTARPLADALFGVGFSDGVFFTGAGHAQLLFELGFTL